MDIDNTKANANIRTLISQTRNDHQLSQRDFADVLGVSFQVIDLWESGQRPSTDILIRISRKANEQWARNLALRCLNLRYPGVFISPKPKEIETSPPIGEAVAG